MSKSQSTELQVFNGGLHLQPVRHLINNVEARYLANVNTRKANLTPFNEPKIIQDAEDLFGYFYEEEHRFYGAWRSNALYNGVWYWTDGINAGKMYKDGSEYPLGIAPPTTRLTVELKTPVDVDGLFGEIHYVYTYYDPQSGSESPPSPPSLLLMADGNAVQISDIVPSPEGLESRIYRLGGIITAYSAVVTLDTFTTSYLDQLSFLEIQGMVLTTMRAYPPPEGIQFLTEHQGRFYASVGAHLYYSAAGKPDSWYALDFISFEEPIRCIATVANGLIVMTENKSWLITGITPSQFVKHTLSDSEGSLDSLCLMALT